MKYEEVVRYIEDIPKFTKKHTLLHTREFMRRLGNPCQGRKVLHVAGTNGKGSVCAYMQAILLFEGKRVGFFTSPHLVKLNERIRINGKDIDDDTFCRIFAKVRQVAEELEKEGMEHPSYFEFLYGMGMLAFEESDAEYIVLETGLVVNMVRFLITVQNLLNRTLFRMHRKKTSVRYVRKCLVSHPI